MTFPSTTTSEAPYAQWPWPREKATTPGRIPWITRSLTTMGRFRPLPRSQSPSGFVAGIFDRPPQAVERRRDIPGEARKRLTGHRVLGLSGLLLVEIDEGAVLVGDFLAVVGLLVILKAP